MPEETEEFLGGGNIGDCSEVTMLTTAAFASLTMLFALMRLLWFTVLSDHYGSTRAAIAHFALLSATMICSLITIAVFWITINPLRSGIDPTFCDGQSAFEDCEEAVGVGLYCQVATAVLSFVQILIYASTSGVNASAISLSCCGKEK